MISDNKHGKTAILTDGRYMKVELWPLFKDKEWFNYQERLLQQAKAKSSEKLEHEHLKMAVVAGLTKDNFKRPSSAASVGSGPTSPGSTAPKRTRTLPSRPLPPSGNGSSASAQ